LYAVQVYYFFFFLWCFCLFFFFWFIFCVCIGGSTFFATVSVTNLGPSTERSVIVQVPIPANVTLAAALPSFCNLQGNSTINCTINGDGVLLPNVIASFAFTFRTASSLVQGQIRIDAFLPYQAGPNGIPQAFAVVSLCSQSSLFVKVVAPPLFSASGTGLLEVIVSNSGPSDTRGNVSVTFVPPNGLVLVTAPQLPSCVLSPSFGSCNTSPIISGAFASTFFPVQRAINVSSCTSVVACVNATTTSFVSYRNCSNAFLLGGTADLRISLDGPSNLVIGINGPCKKKKKKELMLCFVCWFVCLFVVACFLTFSL
jgi:hypothetical protein